MKQKEEDVDGEQVTSAMNALAKRHLGMKQNEKAIPLQSLVERAKRRRQQGGAAASAADDSAAAEATSDAKELALHDAPASIFDCDVDADGSTSCAGSTRSPASGGKAVSAAASASVVEAGSPSAPKASPPVKPAAGQDVLHAAVASLKSLAASAGETGGASGVGSGIAVRRRLVRKTSEPAALPPAEAAVAPPSGGGGGSKARGGSSVRGSGRGGGSSVSMGGRGVKRGSVGGGKAAMILQEIQKGYEDMLAMFGQASKDADFAAVETTVATNITTWGKKRGALISTNRVDDAEQVMKLVFGAHALRKALQSFSRWSTSRTAQSANSFVGSLKEAPEEVVKNSPVFLQCEYSQARADLEITAGKIAGAVQAVSCARGVELQLCLDDIAAMQAGVFKRHFTAVMRSGDEKRKKVDVVIAELEAFCSKVVEACMSVDSLDFEQTDVLVPVVLEEFTLLKKILRPETATPKDIELALKKIRASEMVKAMRVFDCGQAILAAAGDAVDKLKECETDVKLYKDWLHAASEFANSLDDDIQCQSAFASFVDRHRRLCASLASCVQKMQANTLVAKCIKAEIDHDFVDTCLGIL